VVVAAETKPDPSLTTAREAVIAANLFTAIAAPDLISALSILVIVFVSASIDLLVNTSEVFVPTSVVVAVGSDNTPVFDIVDITGAVNVLLVNVTALSSSTSVPVASGAESVRVVPVVIFPAFNAIFLVLSALSDIVKPSS
jgi:hypothetical protein